MEPHPLYIAHVQIAPQFKVHVYIPSRSMRISHLQYRSDAKYKARVIYTRLQEEANALVH